MKIALAFLFTALASCGTTVKVYDHGTAEVNRVEHGTPMAAVLLVYKANFPEKSHQLFFWDENKNRYNLEVPGDVDTTKGILVYLPAGKTYALSGFLASKDLHWRDMSFGTELPIFFAKAGRITQLAYFEIEVDRRFDSYRMRRSHADHQEPYLAKVREHFELTGEVKSVQALSL